MFTILLCTIPGIFTEQWQIEYAPFFVWMIIFGGLETILVVTTPTPEFPSRQEAKWNGCSNGSGD